MSSIVYIPLNFNRVERSSIWVLWPSCKTTTACSQSHYLEYFGSRQKEQPGSTRCYHNTWTWPTCLEPFSACQASVPSAISVCLAPTSQPKRSGTHKPHRGCFYMRPLFVQQISVSPYKDDVALQELWELSRARCASECHYIGIPPPS